MMVATLAGGGGLMVFPRTIVVVSGFVKAHRVCVVSVVAKFVVPPRKLPYVMFNRLSHCR
jgi:hypothetical protein